MTLSIAVAGASGYAGGELLRILAHHPDVTITTVTAHSNAGQPLLAAQPHLRSLEHLTLVETTPENLAGHDVVFVALPHGKSGELTDHLGDEALVIDCGADHRLTSEADWARFYGGEFFGAWEYGLPELVRADGSRQRERLVGTRRIAVPGCNVTAITLALAPGIQAGLVQPQDLVSVLAVGTSGAGKSLKTHLLSSEIHGSAAPYAVGGTHRHTPEIVQNLAAAGAQDASISFTPMLVPMSRGILAITTARLQPGVGLDEARSAWEQAYAAESFVHVLPEGQFPKTADVLGANTALIGLALDEDADRLVVVSAIDNLVKGTAGAAVQSMNIALGLPEATGLATNGVAP